MPTIFLTGATGYIGGSVAARLVAAGYRVRGLVRSRESAALLATRGIDTVLGTLDDADLLTGEARASDGVINVPLLGQVPLVPALREGGDAGAPIVVAHPDDEAAIVFRSIAERVDTERVRSAATGAAE